MITLNSLSTFLLQFQKCFGRWRGVSAKKEVFGAK